MEKIPRTHPRYNSLITRKKISQAMKNGLVHETGLIAHGRGEAFDYLIGEKTNIFANNSAKVAAASLLLAKNPVISINGNVAALAPEDCISLSESIPAKLEVNLFHRTKTRINLVVKELKKSGAKKVYGIKGDGRIPGLSHNRGICDREGIFSSDVVLVLLEDGDRCQALRNMKKTVIAIDLNPISRTAKSANITIVDNVIRAVPNIEKWVLKLKFKEKKVLENIVNYWDNNKTLDDIYSFISKRLNSLLL